MIFEEHQISFHNNRSPGKSRINSCVKRLKGSTRFAESCLTKAEAEEDINVSKHYIRRALSELWCASQESVGGVTMRMGPVHSKNTTPGVRFDWEFKMDYDLGHSYPTYGLRDAFPGSMGIYSVKERRRRKSPVRKKAK